MIWTKSARLGKVRGLGRTHRAPSSVSQCWLLCSEPAWARQVESPAANSGDRKLFRIVNLDKYYAFH